MKYKSNVLSIYYLTLFIFIHLKVKSQYIEKDSILIIPHQYKFDISDGKYLGNGFVYKFSKEDSAIYQNKRIKKAKVKGGNIIVLQGFEGTEAMNFKVYFTDSMSKNRANFEFLKNNYLKKIEFTNKMNQIIINDSVKVKRFDKYFNADLSAPLIFVSGGNLGLSYKLISSKKFGIGPFAEMGVGIGFLFYAVARCGFETNVAVSKKYNLVLRANREWYKTTAETEYKSFTVPLKIEIGFKFYRASQKSETILLGFRKSELFKWYFPSFIWQHSI